MLVTALEILLATLGLAMVAGTALSFSSNPHWFIRGWDFPRVQILALLLIAGVPYAVFFTGGNWWDWPFLALVGAAAAWQARRILPFTKVWPNAVQRADSPQRDSTLRLVVSNVLMDNRRFDRWLEVIRGCDPDVILAAEVDDAWIAALQPLKRDYPHHLERPQSNCYGMAIYSRLPLEDPKLRFVVQEDIPSIHTWVVLGNGKRVRFHALHPRPPEPIDDQSAAPRDAELVIVGREIDKEEEKHPTIVAGDLNDVAWSGTTRLFLHLTQLLDPRRGRGFYNSFSANSRILRFPLDHVFHSNHFRLIDLRLLDNVGSDHFPVFIALSYEPDARFEQPKTPKRGGEEEEAQEKIDKQVEEERAGNEHGHLSK